MLYFSVNGQSNDYSSNSNDNNMDCNSNNRNDMNNGGNNGDNINNCYGSSMLSNDDDMVFDALGPFEKLCKLCDNPTPSNM